MRSYIVISRVESAENMLVAQPFSPALFRQGPFKAAELFLQVLRREITPETLPQRWAEIEAEKTKRKTQLTAQTWPCSFVKRIGRGWPSLLT